MVAQNAEECTMDMQKALEKPIEMAKEYPVASMLVVFGVGLGVGVLLSQTASHIPYLAQEPSKTMSEKLAKQIYDAVTNAIPPSFAGHFR